MHPTAREFRGLWRRGNSNCSWIPRRPTCTSVTTTSPSYRRLGPRGRGRTARTPWTLCPVGTEGR